MTGLYSRKKLFDDLNNLISKRLQFTVCYIDFNDFKIVNDKYGHAAGDLLLKEFAKRILELKHKKIRGYRMGGDEFVIIIKSNFKVHDCIESIWKITEKEVKITMKDYTKISFAMGVIQNDFFSNADEILKKADSSMYKNKKT
ncbi:MAG: GGDEF domain-containing protein [Clostridia bacterium]|nr:GGDEF domain-containing protein [Clostridia bacterium]MDD4386889.1 GGDEF domain-containing protein [Clostridia bacterium]